MTRGSASTGSASTTNIRSPPSAGTDKAGQRHRRELAITSADLGSHVLRNVLFPVAKPAIALLDLIAVSPWQSDEWRELSPAPRSRPAPAPPCFGRLDW